MHQYFSVGEEVILCSKEQPESNGEYIVFRVINPGEIIVCRFTGIMIEDSGDQGCGYIFEIPIIDNECNLGLEVVWNQSCLRKKHKPSDQSFSEIINSTKEVKA